MGDEIKRDKCPEKYYANSNVFKDTFPTIIALLVVAFFSGNLLNGSGFNIVITLIIEFVFIGLMYGFITFMFKGIKTRLSETYISVCEKGVSGICQLNGYKNRTFELMYNEINKVDVKGERLFLYSKKGNVVLILRDTSETASLIRNKCENI